MQAATKSNGHASSEMPAHDGTAERFILGCVIRDNRSLDELSGVVAREHFYFDHHQKIFEVMQSLVSSRKPVDLVTLADGLKLRDWIADVGGYEYIPRLLDDAPTTANLMHYAGIVRDKFFFRELERLGSAMVRDGRTPKAPAQDVAAEYEQAMFRLCDHGQSQEPQPIGETLHEAMDRINARTRPGAVLGIPTGLIELDRITGGLQEGELTIVGARTSVGKSSLGIGIALHVATEHRLPVLLVSLEQTKMEIAERMLVWMANVSSHLVRTGRIGATESNQLINASSRLVGIKLFIDDIPGQRAGQIASNARRLSRKNKLGLVIVDYLQLVEPDSRREDRHLQIGAITRRLKMLAAELKCPVVAMAQLNRDADDRARPKLRDLRESGSIEQDTDVAILLHRPDENNRSDIEAIVAKNRNGQTGDAKLFFLPQCMKFIDPPGVGSPFDGASLGIPE